MLALTDCKQGKSDLKLQLTFNKNSHLIYMIKIICCTCQFQCAGRMTFCLFAASKREVFPPSKEMQHLLKAYATQNLIFLTLLMYLHALNWCDAH